MGEETNTSSWGEQKSDGWRWRVIQVLLKHLKTLIRADIGYIKVMLFDENIFAKSKKIGDKGKDQSQAVKTFCQYSFSNALFFPYKISRR